MGCRPIEFEGYINVENHYHLRGHGKYYVA